jgi:glycolate oxidase FAD binding subunit
MLTVTPSSAQDLACVLADSASAGRTIALLGRDSKHLMAGIVANADVRINTTGLSRVLQYEPNDLTISVEAGTPFSGLQALLAKRRQMLALDPPFWADSTIGGVIASNSSGPMRRGFGTARDLVIGMTFATVEGKLIKSGGMVVKNVAGLDMAKLMIGSFGTLAAITSVNLRLHSMPETTRSLLFSCGDLEVALSKRDQVLRSPLQFTSMDLLSPVAAARLGRRGYILAIGAGGSRAVLDRYERDLNGSEVLSAKSELDFWRQVREFTPDFLRRQPSGVILKVSTGLTGLAPLVRMVSGPSISRAASGITYVYLPSWQSVSPFWKAAAEYGWNSVVEFASDEVRRLRETWPPDRSESRENAFAMMKRVKQMFDPRNLLNPLRLYGRL